MGDENTRSSRGALQCRLIEVVSSAMLLLPDIDEVTLPGGGLESFLYTLRSAFSCEGCVPKGS